MAVAFDQVFSAEATSGSSISVASVAPAGSDRWIAVQAGGSGTAASRTVSSVTKGATSITDQDWDQAQGAYWSGHQWSLKNPTTTSETVTVNFNAALDGVFIGVMTFTGVDQTTPTDTAVVQNGTTMNPAAFNVSSATGDRVVSSIATGWHTGGTHQGAGTERYNLGSTGNYSGPGAGAEAAGAGTVSVEWGAGSGYSSNYIMAGININAAAGGGATTPKGPLSKIFYGPLSGPLG